MDVQFSTAHLSNDDTEEYLWLLICRTTRPDGLHKYACSKIYGAAPLFA